VIISPIFSGKTCLLEILQNHEVSLFWIPPRAGGPANILVETGDLKMNNILRLNCFRSYLRIFRCFVALTHA